MLKRIFALLLCVVMVFAFVGCNNGTTEQEPAEQPAEVKENTESKTEEAVKITFLNTKGEIQTQLEEVALDFTNDTGVELEIVPCGAGNSPFEKMTSMYASGNAPTLSMMDVGDLPSFEEKMLDLSDQQWVNDAMPGSLDVAKINEQLLAMPLTVEGFGLIYNKGAIEAATGKDFDPKAIKTREDLKALFVEIEEGGLDPMIISPLDWSLAAHYFSLPFTAKGKDLAGMTSLMDSLRAGEFDLDTDETFNGVMDTFDLLAQYNIDKDDPLAGTYDTGAEAVATGKTAFWFMGNWAWPQIKELSNEGDEFGFIPVPLDVAGETNKICAGPSKYVAIDKEQSSEAEIEAALTFLNWLIYEENGQTGLVKKCSLIPAFMNIEMAPDDALAQSITEYMAEGETMLMVLTMPSDHWKEVGAYMQKYLSGYSDRAELFEEIETYWKNVE